MMYKKQVRNVYAAQYESYIANVQPQRRAATLNTVFSNDANFVVQEISSLAASIDAQTIAEYVWGALQRFGVNVMVVYYAGTWGYSYWSVNLGPYLSAGYYNDYSS